jgi:hypothetical protein
MVLSFYSDAIRYSLHAVRRAYSRFIPVFTT